MSTTTTNLALDKPTVGGDANVWGTLLNGNADTLDATLGAFGNAAGTATAKGIVTFEQQLQGKVYGTILNPGSLTFNGFQSGLMQIYGSTGPNGLEFSDVINFIVGSRDVISAVNNAGCAARVYGQDGSNYLTISLSGGAALTYTILAISLKA